MEDLDYRDFIGRLLVRVLDALPEGILPTVRIHKMRMISDRVHWSLQFSIVVGGQRACASFVLDERPQHSVFLDQIAISLAREIEEHARRLASEPEKPR